MKEFFIQQYKKNTSIRLAGFTLIEALVAISIFTLSILALMSVLASGLSNVTYAEQKMTATYLSQEGIEYFRNMRDTFVLYDSSGTEGGWTKFRAAIAACGVQGTPKTCYFNADGVFTSANPMPMTQLVITACSSGSQPCTVPLKYDAATGKYNYTTGTNSPFVRSIQAIYEGGSSSDIRIISTVTWTKGALPYTVSLQEDLFDWIE